MSSAEELRRERLRCTALGTEVERLREALRGIAGRGGCSVGSDGYCDEMCRARATRALQGYALDEQKEQDRG